VTFDDVSLAFGETEAVRNVSFELKQGEIICLLGPSGCGKSTLMRLAAGVERPDGGRILLDNVEVASAQDVRAAGKALGRADVPGLCAVSASDSAGQRDLRA
jgi:ABC-type Fe3+/spermidine/putrescine transport system ATPase subunit